MACKICGHEKRAEIEEMLLARSLDELPMTIADVAAKFNVPVMDLQIHAIMHKTVPTADNPERALSITSAVKSKEAEFVFASVLEYQKTQLEVGAFIRELARPDANGERKLYKLNKATADLYVGIGGEIRSAVDTLVRMNSAINGDENSGAKALGELVAAIRGSATKTDA